MDPVYLSEAAKFAVDGDLICRENINLTYAVLTGDESMWWMVDLQDTIVVKRVELYSRNTQSRYRYPRNLTANRYNHLYSNLAVTAFHNELIVDIFVNMV